MKNVSKSIVACIVCVACVAPSFAQPQGGHDMKEDMKGMMEQGREKMMSMPMTGRSDADFAVMMREHHRSAIEMAQWEIEHGKDQKMKAMARKIIASQKKEIGEFDRFLSREEGHGK